MKGGWRYRVPSVLGTVCLGLLAVAIANNQLVQAGFRLLPVVGHLPFDHATGMEFAFEAGTTTAVLVAALVPLYKPRPRRILDMTELAIRRVLLACIGLAAIGYFDYTYRLPRATLIVAGGILLVAVPAWFVAIRQRPRVGGDRTIIIGDDPESMEDILRAVEGEVLGYVSPPSAYFGQESPGLTEPAVTDGGVEGALDDLGCLGGLSRLDEVLVEHDVDTAVLAFARPDREEFFGALDSCFEHGVAAKVHRDHADVVLTRGMADGELVDIDLEPWDWQDHVAKRTFDVAFAVTAFLALTPVMVAIAFAIKLEDDGPIFYRQERTAAFGDTFRIHKFRSMKENAENSTGPKLSEEDAGRVDSRVTRVGRIIRWTHLDEIPQLWSVLVGRMSVVGPRPERPELDSDIEAGVGEWRRRWFVKPGLTGLAQINDVTGHEPAEKLRYDVEYIRGQSLGFDLRIVVQQIVQILSDVVEIDGADSDDR